MSFKIPKDAKVKIKLLYKMNALYKRKESRLFELKSNFSSRRKSLRLNPNINVVLQIMIFFCSNFGKSKFRFWSLCWRSACLNGKNISSRGKISNTFECNPMQVISVMIYKDNGMLSSQGCQGTHETNWRLVGQSWQGIWHSKQFCNNDSGDLLVLNLANTLVT